MMFVCETHRRTDVVLIAFTLLMMHMQARVRAHEVHTEQDKEAGDKVTDCAPRGMVMCRTKTPSFASFCVCVRRCLQGRFVDLIFLPSDADCRQQSRGRR